MGVALIGDEHVGTLTRPASSRCVDTDGIQQVEQLWVVAGLAGREQDRQRAAPPVDRQVDLHAQPAPGTSQRLLITGRYGVPIGGDRRVSPFFRVPLGSNGSSTAHCASVRSCRPVTATLATRSPD